MKVGESLRRERRVTLEDTGWRPDVSTPIAFQIAGTDLDAELKNWPKGTVEVSASDLAPEELGAVLGGQFELTCGDEKYVLKPGDGLLIPRGEPRVWRVLSEEGVLYRVRHRSSIGASRMARNEERLTALEDSEAIKSLKAIYAAAADAKYTSDFRRKTSAELETAARQQVDCFTEDAVWQGGPFGGNIVGREPLFHFFCASPWRFTVHAYVSPRLSITGDRAEGIWKLLELGVREQDGKTVLLTGETVETYRRTPDGWRIASVSFAKLHSLVLADEPDALHCLISPGEEA